MIVIGVTGGIGSGKSSVSAAFASLGAVVLDADRFSREATADGQPAVAEIAALLGEEVLSGDHSLDRRRVADRIFSSEPLRKGLEAIVHRRVVERIDAELDRLAAEGVAELAVLDVPIPIERGFRDRCDAVIAVQADPEIRTARVMRRSGLSREEVRARMNAQLPDSAYAGIADCVLVNEGEEAALGAAARWIADRLREGKTLPASLVPDRMKW